MPLDDEAIQKIWERAQAATPGPWEVAFRHSLRTAWAIIQSESPSVVIYLDPDKNTDLDMSSHQVDANLDFIQHAREDIPNLIATIQTLKQKHTTDSEENTSLEVNLTIAGMAEKIEKMKQALSFYANPKNYEKPEEPTDMWIGNDLGALARQCLEEELTESS